MNITHDRKRASFQAILAGVLFQMSVVAQQEEEPLRFGDSDTIIMMTPSPESSPSPTPTAKPTPTASVTINPSQEVKRILSSHKPDAEYSRELSELIDLGAAAVPTLQSVFLDFTQGWEARWIAGIALGRIGSKSAKETLEKGVSDPLFLIRMAAAQALAASQDRSMAPSIRRLLDDKAMVVRSAAVDALAQLKDRDSVHRLNEELHASRNFHRGKSLWIREHIVVALGKIGDDKAVPALMKVLKDEDSGLRTKTCEVLSGMVPQFTCETAPTLPQTPSEAGR